MFGFKKAPKKSPASTVTRISEPRIMSVDIGYATFTLTESPLGNASASVTQRREDGSIHRIKECEFPSYEQGLDFFYTVEKVLTS